MPLALRVHNEQLSMCLLAPDAPVPVDILARPLTYFMRTKDEATLICPSSLVPPNVKIESGWIAIEFIGPFSFDETGILTQVAGPLAEAGISILALTTFGTDYVLVKENKVEDAKDILIKAGHRFL